MPTRFWVFIIACTAIALIVHFTVPGPFTMKTVIQLVQGELEVDRLRLAILVTSGLAAGYIAFTAVRDFLLRLNSGRL
jgi:hypothetical protein